MALSGSLQTNGYEGRYYQVNWSATQSVNSNTSTISWELRALGGASSWYAERTLSVTIAGTKVVNKTDRVQRYSGIISSGTLPAITHDSNGAKSFSISISAAVYTSDVNLTASQTFTLNTIARNSTFGKVTGKTIGSATTVTINRNSSAFTHQLWYKLRTEGSWIDLGTGIGTSKTFTVPIEKCSEFPNDTSGVFGLCIRTYNGSTKIGKDVYLTTEINIPDSVIPAISSMTLSDANNHLSTYGGYIQNKSAVKVVTSASGIYGSTITSYNITVGDGTYSGSNITSNLLTSPGTTTVSAKVTDSRGCVVTKSSTITVLPYTAPKITAMSAKRCNADGTANSNGSYLGVIFSSSVASLNEKNPATYTIQYRKKGVSTYTSATLNNYTNNRSISDGQYIFAAEANSSYEIILTVTDGFGSDIKSVIGPSVSKVFSILAKGLGIAFGKVAEKENTADFDWKIHANKGLTVNGTDIQVLINNAVQKMYPVGSIKMSTSSANPSTYMGFGTWVAWGTGRVPIGVNASDSDFSSVEKTGGSKTVNIAHNHVESVGADANTMYLTAGANGGVYGSSINSSANRMTWKGTPATGATRLNKTSTAGSSTQSIVQSYITCYMWKRTA